MNDSPEGIPLSIVYHLMTLLEWREPEETHTVHVTLAQAGTSLDALSRDPYAMELISFEMTNHYAWVELVTAVDQWKDDRHSREYLLRKMSAQLENWS